MFFFFVYFILLVQTLSGLDAQPSISFNNLNITPVCHKGRIRPIGSVKDPFNDVSIDSDINTSYIQDYHQLISDGVSIKKIGTVLEQKHPILNRLLNCSHTLKVLPMKNHPNVWLPLTTLNLLCYDSTTQSFSEPKNFTAYSTKIYEKIVAAWKRLQSEPDSALRYRELEEILLTGYESLSGKPMLRATGKKLFYPTFTQLYLENLLMKLPIIEIIAFFYFLSFALTFFSSTLYFGITSAFIGFMIHSLYLAVRCYILMRPPVSNMYETMIYVPWIVMLTAILTSIRGRSMTKLVIPIASLTSAIILAVELFTKLDKSLENVQAVLDSQTWLIIHVLMVVGSYGLFALSGMFGHIYLVLYRLGKVNSPITPVIGRLNLNILYIGTGMLICGTVLGGVWAAQSWGRFWDWDPKESWAFITCCVYLIWIHAYRFKKISDYGLALGSIIGLHAVIFTWYGVNFILGTGLHSYGFGAGGEFAYYLFLVLDIGFLFFIDFRKPIRHT